MEYFNVANRVPHSPAIIYSMIQQNERVSWLIDTVTGLLARLGGVLHTAFAVT